MLCGPRNHPTDSCLEYPALRSFLRNRTEHISFQYFPKFNASLLNTTVTDHISCQSTKFLRHTCCIDFQTKFLIIDVISARIIRQGICLTYNADSRAGGTEFCIGVHFPHDIFCHLCQRFHQTHSGRYPPCRNHQMHPYRFRHNHPLHWLPIENPKRYFYRHCSLFCHLSDTALWSCVHFFLHISTGKMSVFFNCSGSFSYILCSSFPALFSDVSFLRGSCR